jgi:trans-2,3-dihydro-3-hydroxyanthranilate isomerase
VGSDVATLTGGKPTLGTPLPARDLLDLVGLAADDFAGAAAEPAAAGCGLDFVFLPVRREALARAWADPARARALGVTGISVFAWEEAVRTAYVRVFCPGVSVPEDPATGSAALGLGVWLVARGWLQGEGTTSYTVHQGIEMHRPSLLECTVTAAGGAATLATVSGHVIPVAQGEIKVPPFVG